MALCACRNLRTKTENITDSGLQKKWQWRQIEANRKTRNLLSCDAAAG
jgi:hypothetical protein